ncbi:hypothetical protein C2G38_2179293 [Gigaspora rosea]|uniref:Uncharacterized protein n=1 Tax=Gigaspora rosea TaxID=44941 RepID=A0A397VDD3_9GLOM|nr:hypothetical protein C2G38_2179293 [Gigaspora rosea]
MEIDDRTWQCPKCRQYQPIFEYKGITETYEMIKDPEKGIQIMLSQRIHPDKPYFRDDARNWRKKSGIYLDEPKLQKNWSETVPSHLEWTSRRCNIQDAIYSITLSLFIYPWDWIQEPIAMEPDKSSDWTWHTFQEVVFMNLIPMLQKNQDFIFQEIGKYFNYCEIESLDEQEESAILAMT